MTLPDQAPWERTAIVGQRRAGHPVLVALVGFYVGMVLVVAVPSLYVLVVGRMTSPQQLVAYAPYALVLFVVPLVLIVVPATRRFGRYLLLGMVSTLLVVAVVGGVVLYLLGR